MKLGLVELILEISALYLLWGPSNWFFSVGLGSKWLTCSTVILVLLLVVGFRDNNAHPSSLAFLCLGLSNWPKVDPTWPANLAKWCCSDFQFSLIGIWVELLWFLVQYALIPGWVRLVKWPLTEPLTDTSISWVAPLWGAPKKWKFEIFEEWKRGKPSRGHKESIHENALQQKLQKYRWKYVWGSNGG